MFKVATYAKKCPFGFWSYLGPGCEKKWYGTRVNKPNDEWNRVAEIMMINFAESGHPFFQATSPLERGELKSKGDGKKTIHYNGSEETVELILRTVISLNQLSIYGAVADLRNELDPDYTESVICESLMIPTESANANTISQRSTSSAQGNLLREYEQNFADPEGQKMSTLCKNVVFLQRIGKGQFFITIDEGSEIMQTRCHTHSRNLVTSRPRGWIRSNTKIGPVLDVKLYLHEGRYCIHIMIESLFKDRMVPTNTSQKRHKKHPLRTLNCSSAQGNLLQRLSRDQNLLWICLPIMFLSMKEFG